MQRFLTQRVWPCLSVAFLMMLASDGRGQILPGASAPLTWKELLDCEVVVVGRYRSHEGATLSLEIVEILRGKAFKPGDVVRVKLSQSLAITTQQRYRRSEKDSPLVPQIVYVDEQGKVVQHVSYVYDAAQPLAYFFPKAKTLTLEPRGQVHVDRRDGWKQALAGKPINLSFRLLHDLNSEMHKQAIVELYKTRDRRAIADVVDALIAAPMQPDWIARQAFAERALATLGDKNGDLYDPVWKALSGEPGKSYDHGFRLSRILARADARRAIDDFKTMLKPKVKWSNRGVLWGMHNLETEEGLNLLLDLVEAGESHALDSLSCMMHNQQGLAVPMVKRARVQDLALPRLTKIIKSGVLPRDMQSTAMFREYFRGLVEITPENQLWRTGPSYMPAIQQPEPRSFPDWGRTVYESRNDLEPLLKADLVEGRRLLDERLSKEEPGAPRFEQATLRYLAHYYGDPEMLRKHKKPDDPMIRCREASNANHFREPFSVFMKRFRETRRFSDGYWAQVAALFRERPDEYFKEIVAMIKSDNETERNFAIQQQLEQNFFWNFDLDAKDFLPVRDRQLDAVMPLLDRMSKTNIVAMRGLVLQHFGVKLEGPPGKDWLPAIRQACESWNPTIRLNAFHVLCTLEEDPGVMRFAHNPQAQRKQALEAHLKAGPALRKETNPPAPALLQDHWKNLGSADHDAGYKAMIALHAAPQSTLAWMRKHLKEPGEIPAPDPKRTGQLINDLASPAFKVRTQANADLKKLGEGVVPQLRQALDKARDVETRRRIEEVIDHFGHKNERYYRLVRAVQVLEYLPGPEPRAFLEELAAGPANFSLTHEAKGALWRVKRYWQW